MSREVLWVPLFFSRLRLMSLLPEFSCLSWFSGPLWCPWALGHHDWVLGVILKSRMCHWRGGVTPPLRCVPTGSLPWAASETQVCPPGPWPQKAPPSLSVSPRPGWQPQGAPVQLLPATFRFLPGGGSVPVLPEGKRDLGFTLAVCPSNVTVPGRLHCWILSFCPYTRTISSPKG